MSTACPGRGAPASVSRPDSSCADPYCTPELVSRRSESCAAAAVPGSARNRKAVRRTRIAAQDRLPPPMRFFEYESRRIVAKAGIPVSPHGFATSPEEARRAAQQIGGPTVIKSQVLTGGRMKAGGVKFADTPDEAAQHAEEILRLEINGHMPRGVLVDPKAEVKQEYYAGVVWDGTAKRPLMLFSDMGGIDIEEVAETHPDHVGKGHVSTILPLTDFRAKEVIASVGVSGA